MGVAGLRGYALLIREKSPQNLGLFELCKLFGDRRIV